MLTLTLAGALAFGGCGDDSDGTFERDDFPFTFEYPDGFEERDDITVDQNLGANADQTVAVATDEHDLIMVQRFTLSVPVDEKNFGAAKKEIDGLLGQVDPDATTEPTEIAGLPALTVDDVAVSSIDGAESDLTILFDGDQEYLINCQSTPDAREEVEMACGMAVGTLELDQGT
jgi:hypothetical protein